MGVEGDGVVIGAEDAVADDELVSRAQMNAVLVTFDMNVDSIAPEMNTLFGRTERALPAVGRDKIIMEIKYSDRCPSFIRKCCNTFGSQLSVSKYALCRNVGLTDD